MAYKPKYVKPSHVEANNPTAPAEYQVGTYNSRYGGQIDSALNNVVNWSYDPMNDANYQALAKIYGARGNVAAKNSLADAAALNGGYGTSYAVSAAQQARNQYNQELAALVPDLEANAYNRATNTLNVLRDADNTDYGRWRDTEGDRQWLYSQNYQRYQDALDQYKWAQEWNFNQDKYAQDWNFDLYQYKEAQKKAASGGGSGGRGRSGGYSGGYSGGSVSSDSGNSSGAPKLPSTQAVGYAGAYKTGGKSYAGASGVSNKTMSPGDFNKKLSGKK